MNQTSQDYAAFLGFVDTFSLRSVAGDDERIGAVRRAHGKFLALLATSVELLDGSDSVSKDFSAAYGPSGKKYLREVASDCSEFIMCVLIGLYRSAGGTLRSSIESYLKTFAANERPLILQRTSVPDVFSDASQVSFFSSRLGKRVISELRGVYGELNAYVHTVSEAHMFAVPAVGGFPRWSENNEKLIELFTRIVRLFVYGIVGTRRDLYDQFDYRNRVIANRVMTRTQRRAALGVDD